jgi:hypothetical protein
MKKIFLLLAAALFFCAGCVKQEVEYTKKWGFGFKNKGTYPKLKNYDLTLELSPGARKFQAGVPGELIFILHNRGKKQLRIPEWFKFAPNNLKVQCQIWLPGTQGPEKNMWLDVSLPVKRPIWRYPMVIPAGEKIFVSTNLAFLGNLVVAPGTERRYFIKARLNLKSVDVEAPVTYITVYPGQAPMPVKKIGKNAGKAQ